MRIALIASPFIEVPPKRYGGTELFIAHLVEGLTKRGVKVVLYANGESKAACELRYLYARSEWPHQRRNLLQHQRPQSHLVGHPRLLA